MLARFGTVRRIVNDLRPDILEAHSPYFGAAATVACGRGASRVRTAFWHADHVGTYVEPALNRTLGPMATRILARPLWTCIRALLAPFDATFVAGVAQAARLRDAGVPNVHQIPFGVDVDTFQPRAPDPAMRLELAAGKPGDIVVAAGRLAIEKRWDVVLDAFARLRERRAAVLVIFGDGPERARLEGRAPPDTRFVGFETDRVQLAKAFAAADVLVHGCPYETFGLGVTEAIACGLPVVVPDRGGASESIDPACSETYASLDVHACAAALERILGCDRSELRARCLAAASRVMTAREHFTKVLSVYDGLLAP
jgi:alpha-1,6-mannosyltransferase